MAPHHAGLEERLRDPRRHDERAERQVAGGDPLRARQQVGREPEALRREPASAAAEAGDHLVGDEEHVTLAADLLHPLEIALGRRKHAAGTDHRLAEERRDALRSDLVDRLLERFGRVPVDLNRLEQRAEAGAVRVDAADARAEAVDAVVGVPARKQAQSSPAGRARSSSGARACRRSRSVFIDHGMGVVIGETAEIGDYVTLFQGVTLGGTGKERGKRHPTLGNHVVVGAGAKILGGITIGDNVKIGANSVVLKHVPPDSTVIGVPARVIKTQGERLPDATMDQVNLPDPISDRFLALEQELIKLRKRLENPDEQSRLK